LVPRKIEIREWSGKEFKKRKIDKKKYVRNRVEY
jgi:hypothetical protein